MDEFFKGVGTTFVTVFLSEIGDKTFFLLAALAQKQAITGILLGYQLGLTPLIIFAAYVGKLATYLPSIYVNILACLCFLIFSFITFYETITENCIGKSNKESYDDAELEEPFTNNLNWAKTVLKTCVLIFLAEWGDMSQFAMVSLSLLFTTESVIVGASLGMFSCALIAVLIGRTIGKCIPQLYKGLFSATLFLGIAMYTGYLVYNEI